MNILQKYIKNKLLSGFLLFSLLISGSSFPLGQKSSMLNRETLSPVTVLPTSEPFQRIAPVLLESELWDEQQQQRVSHIDSELLQIISKNFNQVSFVHADLLLSEEESVEIEKGIQLDRSLRREFFLYLVSQFKVPTFVLVSEERQEEVATLLRETAGSNIVIVLPYQVEGSYIEFSLKTVSKGFVHPLIQFFEHYKYSNKGNLIQNIYGFKESSKAMFFYKYLPNDRRLKSSLPFLASFPSLDIKTKQKLFALKEKEVLENLSFRNDLTYEDVERLIDIGDVNILSNLVFYQIPTLSQHVSLANKLIQKLFIKKQEALELLLDFTSKKSQPDQVNWFLRASINHFYPSFGKEKERALFKKRLLDNELVPIWVKGLIVERLIQYENKSIFDKQDYARSIIELLEKGEVFEYFQDRMSNQNDAYALWLRIIISAPHFDQLRDVELLKKLALHYQLESLEKYEAFIKKQQSEQWKNLPLITDYEDVSALIDTLNKVITSKIENRASIFEIVEKALVVLEEKKEVYQVNKYSEMFEKYGRDYDKTTDSLKGSVDIAALLPALIISSDGEKTFENFQIYYACQHVRHSRDMRSDFVNELLLAYYGPRKRVVQLALQLFSKEEGGKNKKRQKEFVKSLRLLNTLFILATKDFDEEEYSINFNSFMSQYILTSSFSNIGQLYQKLTELILKLLNEDFSSDQRKKLNSSLSLSRLNVLLNYLKYKRKWAFIHSEGVSELNKVVFDYLFEGISLKTKKYGEDSLYQESVLQMKTYEAVLRAEVMDSLSQFDLPETSKQRLTEQLVKSYLRMWKKDLRENVNPFENNGDIQEPLVVWTTDDLKDWLSLGENGAPSCLEPDGDPHMNKALLGRMLSGLCKMKYVGVKEGDRSSRMAESLMFAKEGDQFSIILNNEQALTNLTRSDDPQVLRNVVEVMIISALRNAGRYGASRIVIPRSWEGDFMAAFLSYEEKLLSDFSTFIEHRDEEGQLIAREEIKIKKLIRNSEGIRAIGMKERNRWRHWVGRIAVNGVSVASDSVDIVDQNRAQKIEIAGVEAEAVQVDFDGIEILLDKKLTIWSSTDSSKKESLPEKVKELFHQDPSIADDLRQLKKNGLSAAQYLSLMYQASGKVIQFMDQELTSSRKVLKVIVAIPRGGLPVARALKQYWPQKSHKTGYLRAKNGTIVSKYLPQIHQKRKKEIYLVDEVIVSGRSIISSIEELIQHGFEEKEILIMTLGAKLEGVENILKRFPNLKGLYIGVIEDEQRYETVGSVTGLIKGGELSHPMDWDEGSTILIKGTSYQLLHRIESKRSFNLFLAINENGEKVVIKTTVGSKEKDNIYKVTSSLWKENEDHGFVSILEYDAHLGAVVMDFVEGESAGLFYASNNLKSVSQSVKGFREFLNQYEEMVSFLEKYQLYFVQFDSENLIWDSLKKKWYMANYNVFPKLNGDPSQRMEEAFYLHSKEFLQKMSYLFFQSLSGEGKDKRLSRLKRQLHQLLDKTEVQNKESLLFLLGKIASFLSENYPITEPDLNASMVVSNAL